MTQIAESFKRFERHNGRVAEQQGRLDRIENDYKELQEWKNKLESPLKGKIKPIPTWAKTISDMKTIAGDALSEIARIRVNLDQVAIWLENRE